MFRDSVLNENYMRRSSKLSYKTTSLSASHENRYLKGDAEFNSEQEYIS